jgi:hypothetical protein
MLFVEKVLVTKLRKPPCWAAGYWAIEGSRFRARLMDLVVAAAEKESTALKQ